MPPRSLLYELGHRKAAKLGQARVDRAEEAEVAQKLVHGDCGSCSTSSILGLGLSSSFCSLGLLATLVLWPGALSTCSLINLQPFSGSLEAPHSWLFVFAASSVESQIVSRQVLDPIFLDRGEIKKIAGVYRGDETIRAEDQKCATTCSGAIQVEF